MSKQQESLSMMCFSHEQRKFPPKKEFQETAHLKGIENYEEKYRESITNPDLFWLEQAKHLEWIKTPSIGCHYKWNTAKREIKHTWFEDGILNVSSNCLDRHLRNGNRLKPAIIWQGEEEDEQIILNFAELHFEVCRFANVLKSLGVLKGDRVCIYLPMIPELVIAMLACSRIGAIHSVIFGGFSAESLANRLNDSASKIAITSNVAFRGGKKLFLKNILEEALTRNSKVEKVIVVKRSADPCEMRQARDLWWHEEMENTDAFCPPEPMTAEDPLFILYTSGSTGNPKGVVHTQAGYLLYAALTHKYIFDIQEQDVYWCSADIGWITGHSYIIYGPLANGTTTLMYEGIPTYPDPGRYWHIIDKYQVTKFYTAPTVIRLLIRLGEKHPQKYKLNSLRLLGSVGEPINPEAWMWYYEIIGKGKCPVVDTWWQTETGGILISPLAGCHTLKPGSASRPFFGIEPAILRDNGTECAKNEGGSLCIRKPWPGMMRTMWGDHDRFIDTYFTQFKDHYFSGDGCRKDEEGDFWLLGRIDDVVNVSGHRIGTAEVESALVSHEAVAEAAVVPVPDEIKGQALFAFITVVEGAIENNELKQQLFQHVRREIGPIAVPDQIQFAKALPKTRSGKIMRRILRKIASRELDNLGDISTLADPKIIEELIGHIKEDS